MCDGIPLGEGGWGIDEFIFSSFISYA